MAQEQRKRDQGEASEAEHPQPDGGSASQAQEASADAADMVDDIDALLDDVDSSLRTSLGFGPDEVVDPVELERRAAEMVEGYRQKGGQ